jgi:translation initiation factor RLI1
MLNQFYNPIDGVSFVTTCNVLILVGVDYICCLYGTPSAYGVVTMPFSVREGINVFLAGFVPTENLRFRDEELNFKLTVAPGE